VHFDPTTSSSTLFLWDKKVSFELELYGYRKMDYMLFIFIFILFFLSFFLSFKRRMADCVLVMGHCGILEANTHV
jgi:hypothetical protein